ncbi:MAG: hypothetical protein A2289_09740 [Deltaproteobacteria bacterium RIFOXYA12_FULL_58_15]|nr:MAG: hypothetical protein A2289_09740 [Deltaproteobacteria bacterium RIFOXYA12_FULL_58_15]
MTFLAALLASAIPQIGNTEVIRALGALAENPSLIQAGLPFAITLMAILLAHEMGHFLTARRHGVDQSLPYFIPAPTIFGTLGALILMRSQPPNRRVLLDVAVAGPFAGLLLAIPAAIWGLSHSAPRTIQSVSESEIVFGGSLLFNWLTGQFGPDAPMLDLHPVALAGWVGLFVTSLNLIPAAQLDGGHIAYALFGPRQERISIFLVASLFVMGLMLGISSEGFARGAVWVFWALLLFVIGIRHPPVSNELTPLAPRHRVLGWLAMLVLVVTFTPVPVDKPQAPAKQRVKQSWSSEEISPTERHEGHETPAEEFRL